MNIEPSKPAPLQWHQFRLGFLLLLITFVAVVMSLAAPRYTPDTGGKARIESEVDEQPDAVLQQAFSVIIRSGSASTAGWVSLHDELAEEERVAKTAAACISQPQTLPAADKPGG